jgi:hypothetical protein
MAGSVASAALTEPKAGRGTVTLARRRGRAPRPRRHSLSNRHGNAIPARRRRRILQLEGFKAMPVHPAQVRRSIRLLKFPGPAARRPLGQARDRRTGVARPCRWRAQELRPSHVQSLERAGR